MRTCWTWNTPSSSTWLLPIISLTTPSSDTRRTQGIDYSLLINMTTPYYSFCWLLPPQVQSERRGSGLLPPHQHERKAHPAHRVAAPTLWRAHADSPPPYYFVDYSLLRYKANEQDVDYSLLINMNGRHTLPTESQPQPSDGHTRIALLRNQSLPFFNVSGLVPGKSYKLQVCTI